MRYLISYDISDTKIRNKVVKYLESFCYRVQYSVLLCVHAHVRVETITKKLEVLTQGDETRRLSTVTISNTAKPPIWCNKLIPLPEDKRLIIYFSRRLRC